MPNHGKTSPAPPPRQGTSSVGLGSRGERADARPRLYRFLTGIARRVVRLLGPRMTRLLERLPVLSNWTRHRALPQLEARSFREQFPELDR